MFSTIIGNNYGDITSISLPAETVKAEEMPKEYVVYSEESTNTFVEVNSEEAQHTEEEILLLKNADMAVTQMTGREAAALEAELEEVAEEIIVEENIWLEGTSKKQKSKKKDKYSRKEPKEENAIEDGWVDEETKMDEAEEDAIWEVVDSQWNQKAVTAEEIQQKEDGTIKVAILDSGVDVTEDIDIAKRVSLLEEDTSFYLCEDMTGHGTAVASIIGAKDNEIGTTGINPSLEIYSVKVLDEENRAPLSRVVAALQWCRENDINVVNMSFGTTTYSQILEKAIEDAEEQGMLLVAAAGNGDVVEYPAAYEEVIGVGSIDSNLTVDENFATGEKVEFVAPGVYVPVTAQLGGVTVGSGTSYAAPHVTAIAATLWNDVPNWSHRKIRALLTAGAKKLTEDELSRFGLVDYTYTKSIMEEFSANYKEELEEELIKEYENDTIVESYEMPEYVQANWSATNHGNLVSIGTSGSAAWQSSYTKNKITLIKQVSRMVDHKGIKLKDGTPLAEIKALHATGKTNYVSVTRYLYEVAQTQKKNPTKSIATVLNEKGKPPYLNEGEFAKIKEGIKIVCKLKEIPKTDTTKPAETITEVSYSTNKAGKNRALRVLGMALHVSGDAYAHKAIVPNTKTVRDNIKSNAITAERRNEILTEIKKGTLTTAGLTHRCSDTVKGRQMYEDNIEFLSKRYKVGAQYATNQLLKRYYNNKSFDITIFYPSEYNIKQYKLRTYMTEANGGVTPSGINWSEVTACD